MKVNSWKKTKFRNSHLLNGLSTSSWVMFLEGDLLNTQNILLSVKRLNVPSPDILAQQYVEDCRVPVGIVRTPCSLFCLSTCFVVDYVNCKSSCSAQPVARKIKHGNRWSLKSEMTLEIDAMCCTALSVLSHSDLIDNLQLTASIPQHIV